MMTFYLVSSERAGLGATMMMLKQAHRPIGDFRLGFVREGRTWGNEDDDERRPIG